MDFELSNLCCESVSFVDTFSETDTHARTRMHIYWTQRWFGFVRAETIQAHIIVPFDSIQMIVHSI